MRSTSQVEVGRCIRDYALYPRHEIDTTHARALMGALTAGAVLPAVILDKISLRVIDGFHRIEANLKLYGAEHKIAADLRSYPSEAAMFEEAMILNSGHGKRLSPYDCSRCIIVGREFGLADDVIARQLSLTKERYDTIVKTKIAIDGQVKVEREIKATLQHLSGRELSPRQIQANEDAGGMTQLFYINQVVNMIEGDIANWENPRVIEALRRLHHMLGDALAGRETVTA